MSHMTMRSGKRRSELCRAGRLNVDVANYFCACLDFGAVEFNPIRGPRMWCIARFRYVNQWWKNSL